MKKFIWPVVAGIIIVISATFHCSVYGQCQTIWWLDKVYHFTGGIIAAWIALVWIRKYLPPLTRIDSLIVGLAFVALIGVMWEFLEYFSTVFGPTYWPVLAPHFDIGNLDDTLADLVFDLWGALLFFLLAKK